jgi:hypothetical protein
MQLKKTEIAVVVSPTFLHFVLLSFICYFVGVNYLGSQKLNDFYFIDSL